MPWIRKVKHHDCDKPKMQDIEAMELIPGSIWLCDGCERKWMYLGKEYHTLGIEYTTWPKWKEADAPYH